MSRRTDRVEKSIKPETTGQIVIRILKSPVILWLAAFVGAGWIGWFLWRMFSESVT